MKDLLTFYQYKAPQSYILGGCIIIAAVIVAAAGSVVSLPLLIVGLLMITYRRAYEINLTTGTYRYLQTFLWIRRNKPTSSLAELEYIGVVRIKTRNKQWSQVNSVEYENIKCKMNFVISKRNYIPITTGNRDKLLETAKKIANSANLRIFDVTTPDKKWIEPNTGTQDQ